MLKDDFRYILDLSEDMLDEINDAEITEDEREELLDALDEISHAAEEGLRACRS
jgi:hypothetical protein